MRNAIRSILIAILAIGLANCFDASRGTQPVGARAAKLAIVPRLTESASRAAASLSQTGLAYDRVRIVIVRPATDTLKDTTIAVHAGDAAKTLELLVLAVPDEVLAASVQFQQGSTVLFQGSANVIAIPSAARPGSGTPVEITILYTGPGATATKVKVTPGSGVYASGAPTIFTATAFDAKSSSVADAQFVWSVSDDKLATITPAGVLTPGGTRGTLRVRAVAANGISDSITVTFAPAATLMRIIQGAAQSAAPGSTLPVPVIIEVIAADGLPAPAGGLTASFTALNGGSITPATVAFDSDGRAKAFATLGTRAGSTYLYSVTAGPLSLSFVEIAVVGPPTQLIPSGPTTFTMVAGEPPNPLPTLRVGDADGNSVNGVPLRVTIQKAGVNVTSPFVVPSDTSGVLPVSPLVPTTVGTYNVTIESSAATPAFAPLVYTITIDPGPPAKLGFKQQPTDVKVGAAVAPAITVAIMDRFGNTVVSATNTIALIMDPATGAGVTITGQGSVSAVAGIATFSSLSFGVARTAAKISVAGANLPAVLSATFNIVP